MSNRKVIPSAVRTTAKTRANYAEKTIAPRQAHPGFCVRYHLPRRPLSVDSGGKLSMKASQHRAAWQPCNPISCVRRAYDRRL